MVHRLAAQHEKPMFHDMGFGKGDGATGLEGDDIDMHIVSQISWIDKAACSPAPVCVWHGCRINLRVTCHKGWRGVNSINSDITLSDPVKEHLLGAVINKLPFAAGRNIGIAATRKLMRCAFDRKG